MTEEEIKKGKPKFSVGDEVYRIWSLYRHGEEAESSTIPVNIEWVKEYKNYFSYGVDSYEFEDKELFFTREEALHSMKDKVERDNKRHDEEAGKVISAILLEIEKEQKP